MTHSLQHIHFTTDQQVLLGVICFCFGWHGCVAGVLKGQTDNHVTSWASPTGGSKQLNSVNQGASFREGKLIGNSNYGILAKWLGGIPL